MHEKRIVMKVSGEALKEGDKAIASTMLEKVYEDVELLKDSQLIITVGGGNLFRGRNNIGISSIRMDQIGMLSTLINTLALTDYLQSKGVKAKFYCTFEVAGIAKMYDYNEVLKDLEQGFVVLLAGGVGLVDYSTDLVTVKRAIELKADLILMAKNVDGVYDCDPKSNPEAKKFTNLSFAEFFDLGARAINNSVIDFEAITLLAKHKIPLYIYSAKTGSLTNFINKDYDGTFIK